MSAGAKAHVAVWATAEDGARERAEALAAELRLPLIGRDSVIEEPEGLRLVVSADRLALGTANLRMGGTIAVDFAAGAVGYRRESARRRQPLARAVGLRGGPPSVMDATAGLGRDSFLLACLGCTVVAVERSLVLGTLLEDGLARARSSTDEDLRVVAGRITLVVEDARELLSTVAEDDRPDVVFMDPMYPVKKKAALPKKEMRICRRLVGDETDAAGLLAVARKTARRRVVVKRPKHAPPLEKGVAIEYRGKIARYDVYHTF